MIYEKLSFGRRSIYDLEGFKPLNLDEKKVRELCRGVKVDEEGVKRLEAGSERFKRLFLTRKLTAPPTYEVVERDMRGLEIHNYTGLCPTNVLEINPVEGSCSASCLYCLVSDGDQQKPIKVIGNYPEIVKQELRVRKDENVFFYFSPKTEAFSEPLLETGVSHDILRTFIEHYQMHARSRARLFIATKAGRNHLNFENQGESILGLLTRLKGKVQVNGSLGIMPDYLHETLEPNAATFKDRLIALETLQSRGVYACAVLSQPIIPCYLNLDTAENYFCRLAKAGIVNSKPEFLTVNMDNLAIIAQFVNHFDRERMGEFLRDYVGEDNKDHIKQRCRTAPNREISRKGLELIFEAAGRHNVGISICNWVRKELGITEEKTAMAEQSGFKCLGYQTRMFENAI